MTTPPLKTFDELGIPWFYGLAGLVHGLPLEDAEGLVDHAGDEQVRAALVKITALGLQYIEFARHGAITLPDEIIREEQDHTRYDNPTD